MTEDQERSYANAVQKGRKEQTRGKVHRRGGRYTRGNGRGGGRTTKTWTKRKKTGLEYEKGPVSEVYIPSKVTDFQFATPENVQDME